jgi:hypothetical protein
MRIERHGRFKASQSAAADRAAIHRAQCRGQHARIEGCVGVDEKQPFAQCGAPAGIARRGDLAMIDRNDHGFLLSGDFRRRIGRGVVDDDHFVLFACRFRTFVDRIQRSPQHGFFVMCRDDEREHDAMLRVRRFRFV